MTLGIVDILDQVSSKVAALGMFETVLTHEPKSAPQGPAAAVFLADIIPFRERSGLASVSVGLTLVVRLYANMTQDPQDNIDRDMVLAADALMTAFVGDLDLGDDSREIDALGQFSTGVRMRAGYINQDSTLFRVIEIDLPIIINDAWTEVR